MKWEYVLFMKSWRKLEIGQTLLSAIILISLASLAFYYVRPTIFKYSSPEAVKLMLSSPHTIDVNRPEVLRIYAANSEDQIDRSRNDTIDLSLNPPHSGVKLSASRVTLLNGEATFTLTGTKNEVVTLTATWANGRTKLEPAATTISFLSLL